MTEARGQCPRCRQLVGVVGGMTVDHTATMGVEATEDHLCPGSGQPALEPNARETR